MHCLFLSKVPVNEPLQVPQQGPMERADRLQGLFLQISQIPYKTPLNKNFFPSLQGPRKASFNFLQKRGPCGNRCPFPEPYLAYIGVTSKGASPPASPHRAPAERCPIPRAFLHLSTSPVYEPPSRFPSGAPMGMLVSRAFSIYEHLPRFPSNEVPPPGSRHTAPSKKLHA